MADSVEILVSRLAGRFLADVERLADTLDRARPDVEGLARAVADALVEQATGR